MTKTNKRPLSLMIGITGIVIAMFAMFGATFYLANLQSANEYAVKHQGCSPDATNHVVTIKNGKVLPRHTLGKRCDKLTITNLDGTERLMAFGQHSKHIEYDGISEKVLVDGASVVVSMVKTGDFKFHDHEHDEVQGTFTVSK